MNISDIINNGDYNSGKLTINNDGQSYLNNPYDSTCLINKTDGNIYPIKNLIAPGASITINVTYKSDENPDFILRSQYGKIAESDELRDD